MWGIVLHRIINAGLYENKLPSLDFRFSADYSKLSIAKIVSTTLCLFVNLVPRLLKLDNFVLTAHIAGWTAESAEATA